MTRIEYDLLREERPELKLPSFTELAIHEGHGYYVPGSNVIELDVSLPFTRDELIAHRAAMLLTRDSGDMPKGTL